jgi:hypothetical protein
MLPPAALAGCLYAQGRVNAREAPVAQSEPASAAIDVRFRW